MEYQNVIDIHAKDDFAVTNVLNKYARISV